MRAYAVALLLALCLASAASALDVTSSAALPVTAQSGSYILGATSLPRIICPTGFERSYKDADIMLARKLTDLYFIKIARPKLLAKGNTTYGCPSGAEYVDGDPFFSTAALGDSKHNSASVCVPLNRPTTGAVTFYGQAVINYHCKGSSKALHVGVVLAKGYYGTPLPPPPSGPITPISGSYALGTTSLPKLPCPSLFKPATKDADIVLARKLADLYFANIARAELLAKGNTTYGCPGGAEYVDGDPFFSSAALGDTKHNSVTACVLRTLPPKGSNATLFARAVINYHCTDTPSRALHVGVKLAKGRYVVA